MNLEEGLLQLLVDPTPVTPRYKITTYLLRAVKTRNEYAIDCIMQRFRPSDLVLSHGLQRAVETNYIAILDVFARVIDAPIVDHYQKKSPLHLAPSGEMVDALVRLGARLDAKCVGSLSPLHTAENIDVMKALIRHGIDVNIRDFDGHTPLWKFIRDWHRDTERFVEECNPEINFKTISPKRSIKHQRYFFEILPARKDRCIRVVLLLIWANPFRERNLSKRIAHLVWMTRRSPEWERETRL